MSRLTKGSLVDLPPGCRDAYQRARDRDQREGDGSVGDFVLSVARAVWRAGIRHGREQERARRALEDRRAARRRAPEPRYTLAEVLAAVRAGYDAANVFDGPVSTDMVVTAVERALKGRPT